MFNELSEPTKIQQKSNNDINAIEEVRELFNERRSILNHEETKRIREKLYNFLNEGSLTNEQKNSLKNFKKYLKKYSKRFRKYNTTYDLDYLFNELNEPTKIDQKSIKEARDLFNETRSNLSHEETKRIRKKLYKKEPKYNFLKEKEQKDSLTNIEKRKLKNINRYLKNLKENLEKLQKYQYNITYGLDHLFNEDYYYKPKEIKSAFDGSYMLYESKGDKDAKLSIDEYFDKIKPFLKDMIDDHKARGKWKIQLVM